MFGKEKFFVSVLRWFSKLGRIPGKLFLDRFNDPFHSVPDTFTGGRWARLDLPDPILDQVKSKTFCYSTGRSGVHLQQEDRESRVKAREGLSHITLGSDHWYTAPCPGPWVWASVMTNSFLDPSITSMLSLWLYLVYLIWCFYLSVKFVMLIVKQKIENKQNLFYKVN